MSKINSTFSGFAPIQGPVSIQEADAAKSSSPFENKPSTGQENVDNTFSSTSDFSDTRVFNTMDTLIGKVPDGLFDDPAVSTKTPLGTAKAGTLASTSFSTSLKPETPPFSLLKPADTPFNASPVMDLTGSQATKELEAMSSKGGFSFEKTESGGVKVALPMFGVKYTDADLLPAATAKSKTFTFPSATDALNSARFSHWASSKGVDQVTHRGFKDHLQEDGIFGPRTQDAVRDFQAKNNLPVTGSVGKKTFSVLESVADKLGLRSWFSFGKSKPAPAPKTVKPVGAQTAAPANDSKASAFVAPDQAGVAKTSTQDIFNPKPAAKAGQTTGGLAGSSLSWKLSQSLPIKTADKSGPTAEDVRSGKTEIGRNDTKSFKLVERIQSLLNRIRAKKAAPTAKKEPVRLDIHGFSGKDPATGQSIQRYEYPKYIKDAFSSFRESVQSNYNQQQMHKASQHQQDMQIQEEIIRQENLERFLEAQQLADKAG